MSKILRLIKTPRFMQGSCVPIFVFFVYLTRPGMVASPWTRDGANSVWQTALLNGSWCADNQKPDDCADYGGNRYDEEGDKGGKRTIVCRCAQCHS